MPLCYIFTMAQSVISSSDLMHVSVHNSVYDASPDIAAMEYALLSHGHVVLNPAS